MLGHVCASHDGGLLHEVRLSGNRFDSAACRAWLPSLSAGMALDFTVQEVDGLFHADPRPANLLVAEVAHLGAVPTLLDFGLCKRLAPQEKLAAI